MSYFVLSSLEGVSSSSGAEERLHYFIVVLSLPFL